MINMSSTTTMNARTVGMKSVVDPRTWSSSTDTCMSNRRTTNAVFDIACLNEQSRNNDGHEGSSDGVLSDYPTVYCGIF